MNQFRSYSTSSSYIFSCWFLVYFFLIISSYPLARHVFILPLLLKFFWLSLLPNLAIFADCFSVYIHFQLFLLGLIFLLFFLYAIFSFFAIGIPFVTHIITGLTIVLYIFSLICFGTFFFENVLLVWKALLAIIFPLISSSLTPLLVSVTNSYLKVYAFSSPSEKSAQIHAWSYKVKLLYILFANNTEKNRYYWLNWHKKQWIMTLNSWRIIFHKIRINLRLFVWISTIMSSNLKVDSYKPYIAWLQPWKYEKIFTSACILNQFRIQYPGFMIYLSSRLEEFVKVIEQIQIFVATCAPST